MPVNIDWINTIINNWKPVDPANSSCNWRSTYPFRTEIGLGIPSAPEKELYHYTLGDTSKVDLALNTPSKPNKIGVRQLRQNAPFLLAEIAQQLRRSRAELIGAMILDGGKTIQEADIEVSEAIDFAEYYRRNIEESYGFEDIQWIPKGTVFVAPPWNFPCSIPAGGMLAALATGNCVIFKPSPSSSCGMAAGSSLLESRYG